MKRIACTMIVAVTVLWIAGCSPSEPEPSGTTPESKPAAETRTPGPGDQAGADQPELGGQGESGDQTAGEEPGSEGPLGKTTSGRVVGAVGKALLKSVGSDTE